MKKRQKVLPKEQSEAWQATAQERARSMTNAQAGGQTFDVCAYVVVKIIVKGVAADSQLAAVETVENTLRPNDHCDREIGVDVEGMGHIAYAEYADEFNAFMVDEVGDTDHARTRYYEMRDGAWVGTK